ncbi:MAG: SEC-C domain-containing protein, partial [gamma proteobacterium symbiont of Lucinoma myriamae]|nr:SEC-C domain-containing protein [gamma proteobacterium symbiont of Lucinoma myriamae]
MSKKSSYKITSESDCPCQSGLLFSHCCQRFLDSSLGLYPETSEQLMRSRYSAYVLDDLDYILKTWHPDHRPNGLDLTDSGNRWIGLKIKATQLGQSGSHRFLSYS